jgi:hypothetical protein
MRGLFVLQYIAAVALVTALVLELVSACALRLIPGHFHLRPDFGAFTYHPALVGLPTPGYARHDGRMHVSHNTAGFRGRELDSWWWGAAYRIAAVGGSMTYDIALSDDDTWVAQLGARLGSGAATLNMGAPGHSTKETGAVAVDDVLKHTWDASDFVDSGHFSRRGASKFAAILAHAIRPRLPELSMRAASRTCDWHHAAMP